MIKNYDFKFANRYEFDPSMIELNSSGPNGTVLQFKTARGRNILRSLLPTTDNPSIPTSVLQRLTDGNMAYPFRHGGVTEFKFTLPVGTNTHRIVVRHEPGTQPNDVVIAISTNGIDLDILFNNDIDNSLGLGAGSDPQFIAGWDGASNESGGWDPVRQVKPLTSEGELIFDLNCESTGFLYVYTKGFISGDPNIPSSDETRISEIELYDCIYSPDKPELKTKETIRMTKFNSISIEAVETSSSFILWNPVVNEKSMFFDGVDWIEKVESHQSNTTAEVLANIDSLFILPTVYEVSFIAKFVSEIGEESAHLLELSVDFENDAAIKADTTTVYGRTAQGVGGMPDEELFLTIDLELGSKESVTTAQLGTDTRIVFASIDAKDPANRGVDESTFKVDSNGVFRREVIPNSIMTADRSQYIFTFWRKNPRNDKRFTVAHQVTAEIPKIAKYDLGTII